MSNLPTGWTKAKVGDIITLNPKNNCEDETEVGFVPLHLMGVRYRDVPSFERRRWSEVKRGYTHFADGDVLVARITPSFENGKGGIVRGLPNGLGAGSTEYFVCRPLQGVVLPEYLLAHFKTIKFLQEGERVMNGAVGQQRVPKQYLLDSEIPLPPLAEQQRIADKLDTLLAQVDACRARLARVPAILKRFRQAVLAAAVAGRLTEDWREGNAEMVSNQEFLARLSQRISKNGQSQLRLNDDERFIEADLPSGWQYIPVSLVGDVYLGRQRSPDNHNGPYMRPYVRAANITWQGWDLSDVKEMNFDPKDFARYKLQVGDVLINEGSGSADEVGKPAIWKGGIEDCCFQNTLICVRPHEGMSDYLYYVFLHAAMSKSFVEDTRGVNIFHIGKDRFSAYLIPLPSLAEQHEIVRRVETLFGYADRLETRTAAARARVQQLTPSLLAKAFRGELVSAE